MIEDRINLYLIGYQRSGSCTLKEAKSIAAEAKKEVANQKEQLAENNRERNTLNTKCEKLVKANQQNELKVQELHHTKNSI